MRIKIRKGLDLPLEGEVRSEVKKSPLPSQIALNLDVFEESRFRPLVQIGENVAIGQPLVENKSTAQMLFVSPTSGKVTEIRRGKKRRLLAVVIETDGQERYFPLPDFSWQQASSEEIVAFFLQTGLWAHIRMRPFEQVASPSHLPRDIFVRALESAPFTPSAEMQIQGYEEEFAAGIQILTKLTQGNVHIVHREGTSSSVFTREGERILCHSATGPHPIANASVHIDAIAPIRHARDVVWTLSAYAVACIGSLCVKKKSLTKRIVALGGSGWNEEGRYYYETQIGAPLSLFIPHAKQGDVRFFSGTPLTGGEVGASDFLGFFDTTFTALFSDQKREPFHFFRWGRNKYSATRAYFSSKKARLVTTHQHGEVRPFVDASIYQKVMPLRISTIHFIKALLADDIEQAEELGLLEVAPEDFALPSYICPSKIEMIPIVREALSRYAKELC